MKTLKAKISHPRKKILKISDLTYNQHYHKYNVKLDQGVDKITDIMENPIEVFKHKIKPDHAGAHHNLAMAFKESGKFEKVLCSISPVSLCNTNNLDKSRLFVGYCAIYRSGSG